MQLAREMNANCMLEEAMCAFFPIYLLEHNFM